MTATQPDSDQRMTRRGVMRRTALGIGAATTLSGAASTNAAAVDWETAGKIAASTLIGGPAAAAVIAYGAITDGPDDSEVAAALDWQSHVDEFTRAREDQLMLEQTLASLGRDVQLIENKAREEAIFRIYEQGVDSGTESDATAAAEAAINEAYATVERSILNSWSIRATRAENILKNLGSSITQKGTTTDQPDDDSGLGPIADAFSDASVTDLAGNEITYNRARERYGVGSGPDYYPAYCYDPWPATYESTLDGAASDGGFYDLLEILEPDPADYASVDEPLDVSYSRATMMNASQWYDLLVDLHSAHSAMMSEVSSMVSTYFGPAQNGEINLADVRGPAHLTNTAKNAKDYQEATMALRAMGFSIADQASVVSFKQDGTTYELDGRLARTVQDPNDLPVGAELDPSNITGSVYGAFNIKNDAGERVGEIFEITNPFTIETAEGASSVSFQTRTLVGSDSTLTNEEIQQIFAENYEENQEATENVYDTATNGDGSSGGGGAGGGFFGEDTNYGVLALGAGVLAIGWGYVTGDEQ